MSRGIKSFIMIGSATALIAILIGCEYSNTSNLYTLYPTANNLTQTAFSLAVTQGSKSTSTKRPPNTPTTRPTDIFTDTSIPPTATQNIPPTATLLIPTATLFIPTATQYILPTVTEILAAPSPSCPNGCTNPPSGCGIKGNISINTGEKIYHLPGMQYYDECEINPSYGERWFCTEEEAVANGWRKSKR